MKKQIKLFSLITVLCIVIGLFSGCSKEKAPSPSSGGGTTSSPQLVWYMIGDQPADIDMVMTEVNKYLKEKINATLKITFISFADFTQKMGTIINSGENYDITFTCSWANDFKGNVFKGAFKPLNELLEKYGKQVYDTIDPRFWSSVTLDGKIYAIPTNKELPWAPMWVFNKELAQKHNIDVSKFKSLESLEPALKIIKEKEKGVAPLGMKRDGLHSPFDEFDMILGDDYPVGVNYTDKDTKVVFVYETDIIKRKLNTLRDYFKKGYINQDAPALEKVPQKRFVSAEHGQPYAETSWTKDFGFEVVATPKGDNYITTGSSTGAMNAISINSKNSEKAMELLNLVNTDEKLRNMLNFGLEGTHYTKTGDKSINLTDKGKEFKMTAFSIGNMFITYTVDPEPHDKWTKFEEFNKNAHVSPILGFTFNTETIKNEMAAVNNVTAEYKSQVLTGSVDIEKVYPQLIDKYKKAGIEKIITVAQKQIDEWKKTNTSSK